MFQGWWEEADSTLPDQGSCKHNCPEITSLLHLLCRKSKPSYIRNTQRFIDCRFGDGQLLVSDHINASLSQSIQLAEGRTHLGSVLAPG
jgi:hypothetical protein